MRMSIKIEDIIKEQQAICNKYGAQYVGSNENLKLGIALNVKDNLVPINGLRVKLEEDTTGWYIWAGEEFSQNANFFVPLHVAHIDE